MFDDGGHLNCSTLFAWSIDLYGLRVKRLQKTLVFSGSREDGFRWYAAFSPQVHRPYRILKRSYCITDNFTIALQRHQERRIEKILPARKQRLGLIGFRREFDAAFRLPYPNPCTSCVVVPNACAGAVDTHRHSQRHKPLQRRPSIIAFDTHRAENDPDRARLAWVLIRSADLKPGLSAPSLHRASQPKEERVCCVAHFAPTGEVANTFSTRDARSARVDDLSEAIGNPSLADLPTASRNLCVPGGA